MATATTDQFIPATLSIKDDKGRDAKVDGIPVWASSDETVMSVIPGADGMSGTVNMVAPGTARISVSADADLGAGVIGIAGVSEDIIVTPGSVASLMTLTLGAPAPKP